MAQRLGLGRGTGGGHGVIRLRVLAQNSMDRIMILGEARLLQRIGNGLQVKRRMVDYGPHEERDPSAASGTGSTRAGLLAANQCDLPYQSLIKLWLAIGADRLRHL